MSSACEELFHYAAGFVASDDVPEFAPCDPGYWGYVDAWQEILTSRSLPPLIDFDVAETIGLTRWADADGDAHPARFRRFRVFTNAVALAMGASGRADDDTLPPNYTLISLMDDAEALCDRDLWALLSPAFEEAHAALVLRRCDEAVFGLLALLLIHARQGASEDVLADLAGRLVEQERRCKDRASPAFVLGCTHYDQLHHRWKRLVARWIKPESKSLEQVRTALLARAEA